MEMKYDLNLTFLFHFIICHLGTCIQELCNSSAGTGLCVVSKQLTLLLCSDLQAQQFKIFKLLAGEFRVESRFAVVALQQH